MDYKYFGEIIKQNDNGNVIENIILREICEDKLRRLCFWCAEIIDWKRIVFEKDIEHFRNNNEKNMFVWPSVYNREPIIVRSKVFAKSDYDSYGEDVKSIDELIGDEDVLNAAKRRIDEIGKMDIAAMAKLLQYNILKEVLSEPESDSLIEVVKKIRISRNKDSAHISTEDRGSISNENVEEKTHQLINLAERAASSCVNHDRVREILIDLTDDLNDFLKEYRIATGLDQEDLTQSDEIDVEKLFAYNVFIDGSVFESDYLHPIDLLLVMKKVGGVNNTFVEKEIIQGLAEKLLAEKQRGGGKESRRVLASIDTLQNNNSITIIDNNKEYNWWAEAIVDHIHYLIKTKPETKICVLTEDMDLANEVILLNKHNIIAVHPKGSKHFSILKPDREIKPVTDMNHESEVRSEKDKKKWITVSVDHSGIGKADSIKAEFDLRADKHTNAEVIEDDTYYEMPVEGGIVYVDGLKGLHLETLYKRLNGGGEGSIYDYGAGNRIIKIFDKKGISNEKKDKIHQMIEYYKEHQSESMFESVCWPQQRVLDRHQNKTVGYVMKYISQSHGTVKTLQGLINLLSEKPDNYQRIQLVNCCKKMVEIFKKLHESNVLVGDVNPNNILVTMTDDRVENVFFIDVDSYQFLNFNCNVGTKEYTSPRLYRTYGRNLDFSKIKRTVEDERFSIAVLLFFTLFLGELPFFVDAEQDIITSIINKKFRFTSEEKKETKRNYIWKNLTEDVKTLFRNAFERNVYCSEDEWLSALGDLMNAERREPPEVSNELYPNDAIEKEGDYWRQIKCQCCKKLFWIAKAKPEYDDDWCKSCKEIRMLNLKRVYRLICKSCGETWTCSKWDLIQGRDIRRIKCPDCDDTGITFSKFRRVENADNKEGLIVEWQKFAFRNL